MVCLVVYVSQLVVTPLGVAMNNSSHSYRFLLHSFCMHMMGRLSPTCTRPAMARCDLTTSPYLCLSASLTSAYLEFTKCAWSDNNHGGLHKHNYFTLYKRKTVTYCKDRLCFRTTSIRPVQSQCTHNFVCKANPQT